MSHKIHILWARLPPDVGCNSEGNDTSIKTKLTMSHGISFVKKSFLLYNLVLLRQSPQIIREAEVKTRSYIKGDSSSSVIVLFDLYSKPKLRLYFLQVNFR